MVLTHTQRAERRAQIAEHVGSGATLAEAAQKYGVSVGTAWSACREHAQRLPAHVTRSVHWRRTERHAQIAQFVKSGRTLGEAARQFQVSVWTAARACHDQLGELPPHAVHARQSSRKYWGRRTLEVLSLLVAGNQSQAEIARQLGLSRERVRQVAEKAIKLGILSPEGKKWRRHRRRHSTGASARLRRRVR